MQLIKEIGKPLNIEYKLRRSARGIIINEDNKIAVMYFQNEKFHQLPGGGIDEDEDMKSALIREVREEMGAEIEISKEIGMIIEYRNETKQMRISYCYVAKLKNISDYINPTKDEKDWGMKYKWYDLEEAIKNIEEDNPVGYMGFPYIKVRELDFLNKYKELIKR